MPSSYSARLRFNLQAAGENLNTWGALLNSGVFQLVEDAISKRVAFTLSGTKTLSTANGTADEARCAFLDVTSGTGGTVTIPAVEKIYVVRNNTSGDVIVTTGAGATATLKSTETNLVVCDGGNVRPLGVNGVGFKAYVDATAFAATALPGQGPGTAGDFIKSNGSTASWEAVTTSDITDYAADQTARQTAQEDFALVMALIF